MYVPKHFEERDLGILHALIRAHPLGTWVVQGEQGLTVNHIPFQLDETRGANGTLVGHVSRQNPVWKALTIGRASVAVFQGSQGYITPSWYPSKQDHGKVVPTWNYAVVHAHGIPRAIEDKEWLRAHVTALVDTHEAERELPWEVSDAPADYINAMLGAIVGIEIPIDSVVGKWKVSQNRAPADQRGVIAGLEATGDKNARLMAAEVQRHAVPSSNGFA